MPAVFVKRSGLKTRSTHAMRAAAIHLLLSAMVAGGVAALVFGIWFPAPLRELVGGTALFWLVVGVNVACGPLLTLVVFNPSKPRAELRRDLILVTVIQLLALGYGIYTLAHARPVALVHEVDRFRVVTYSDLDEAEDMTLPAWAKAWSLSRPRTMGLRPPSNSDEMMSSVSASLQGVEPSQRPSRWQDYSLSISQVLARAYPVSDLRDKYPEHLALIDLALEHALANPKPKETVDGTALRWMPLVSRRTTDWVILLDPVTARVRGYIHLDGF